jgi:hypothetical protein
MNIFISTLGWFLWKIPQRSSLNFYQSPKRRSKLKEGFIFVTFMLYFFLKYSSSNKLITKLGVTIKWSNTFICCLPELLRNLFIGHRNKVLTDCDIVLVQLFISSAFWTHLPKSYTVLAQLALLTESCLHSKIEFQNSWQFTNIGRANLDEGRTKKNQRHTTLSR